MIHILNYCPCVFLKQWSMPFCACFTTFSIVMTILILSTDLKVGRRYMEFNTSYLWDFEEIRQDSPQLSALIREKYFQLPALQPPQENFTGKPSVQIFNVFRKKRFGIFMECGSDGNGDVEWLEKVLGWQGLLTQPRPEKFNKLLMTERNRSQLAQVCISPTTYPKHAFFKNRSLNETLTAVPCFPLYALMRAYNTSHLDLLSLNDVTAPLQVLKTLPVGRLRIKVIMIRNSDAEGEEEYEDLCCNSDLTTLLDNWGYKSTSSCLTFQPRCLFVCSRTYCPMVTTKS